jgi:hypothetical protein
MPDPEVRRAIGARRDPAIVMMRWLAGVLVVCAMSVPIHSRAQARCTRADLQAAVDSYLAAQAKGVTATLRLMVPVKYIENMRDWLLEKGIVRTPLKIDFHRSLLDAEACETFTEVVVTDKEHPYVLGVRLKVASGRLAEIDTLVTDKDDWLFNAESYLKYSSSENWSVVHTLTVCTIPGCGFQVPAQQRK